MLELSALQLLDTIARHGSFAAAAESLGKAPSAVTYQIRQLEDTLDILLFDRAGHKAVLTTAGKALLEEGRFLLGAADALERKVKRIALGWEPELRIVVDNILPFACTLPWIRAFDALGAPTQLRFTTEVLSGSWDALISGRVDLLIGGAYGAPDVAEVSTGLNVQAFGSVRFVFAVAPSHPLATAAEPLKQQDIAQHRAVAVGDTSRSLPSKSHGLLRGQTVLTVPTLQAKLQAHIAGLGCGWLPTYLCSQAVEQGHLIIKQTESPAREGQLSYAWRRGTKGKALAWWVDHLSQLPSAFDV